MSITLDHDSIVAEWKTDSRIDESKVIHELTRTPHLHAESSLPRRSTTPCDGSSASISVVKWKNTSLKSVAGPNGTA
jgi:hypothetical protein